MSLTDTFEDDPTIGTEDERPDPSLLADARDLVRLAVDYNPDVTGVVDSEGTFVHVAGNILHLLGMSASTAIGTKIWDFVHPDDLVSAAGAINEASRVQGDHLPTVFRCRHATGDWVECEVKGTTFDGPGGMWMVLSVRGTRDRDKLMDRRRAIEQLIREASTACSAVSWEDANDVVEEFLQKLARIVDARSAALVWEGDKKLELVARWPNSRKLGSGVPFEPLWSPDLTAASMLTFSADLPSEPQSAIRDTLIGAGAVAVVEIALSNGSPWRMMRLTFDDNWTQWDDANVDLVMILGTALLATLSRCWAERSLKVQASTDSLTGLMNRTELYRVLQLCLEDRRSDGNVAVLYADLNYFKQVNDTHGHSAGDQLLVEVADALRSSVRAVDVLARVGGDEFVIVCPDIEDPAQIDGIVRRIETTVSALARPDRRVAISVGRAMSGPGATGDQLIREADEDMYRVKRAELGQTVSR